MIIDPKKYIGPILFECAETREIIPTGHRMRAAEFEAMTGSRSFRCRACGEIHSWTTATAHLGYPSRPLEITVPRPALPAEI
jgi:hypothetical protein